MTKAKSFNKLSSAKRGYSGGYEKAYNAKSIGKISEASGRLTKNVEEHFKEN